MDDNLKIIELVLALGKKTQYEEAHAFQVTKLALRLFDELKELHHLSSDKRVLLQSASLLHDIGWIQGQKGHHKASRDLILEEKDIGLNQSDRMTVALVARYHRKSLPAQDHKYFSDMNAQQQDIVCKLSALLRIADGLDRRHVSSVKDLRCKIDEGHVSVMIESDQFDEVEEKAAYDKSDLFEAVFKKKILIIRDRR